MENFLAIVDFIFLIGLVVGWKKPQKALFWLEESKQTKKNLLLYLGAPFLVFFILFGAVNEHKQATVNAQAKAEATKSLEDKQNSYLTLLDSDKTYDTMSDDEKKLADNLISDFSSFEKDFKDKYQTGETNIENSKTQYVAAKKKADDEAKAKADAEAKKAKEEADAKAAQEAAAQEAAAQEAERKAYDTGITYDQLARTPDDYKEKKAKFTGKVIQVIEGNGETDLRIAVNQNYDTVLMVAYDPKISSTRILENDNVTVKGVSQGIYTYDSTMGGKISVPSMTVDEITINK